MTNVIEVNFGNNSKELLHTNQIIRQQVEFAFISLRRGIEDKLERCNGARPGRGFMSNWLMQKRRRDIYLIKGERNGTQS